MPAATILTRAPEGSRDRRVPSHQIGPRRLARGPAAAEDPSVAPPTEPSGPIPRSRPSGPPGATQPLEINRSDPTQLEVRWADNPAGQGRLALAMLSARYRLTVSEVPGEPLPAITIAK